MVKKRGMLEEQARSSLVKVKIGSRYFDAHTSTSCSVCNHVRRHEIEKAIVQNYGFFHISRQYSGLQHISPTGEKIVLPTLAYDTIKDHFQRHMPMEPSALRRIAEVRAEDQGGNLDELNDQYLDTFIYAKSVMKKSFDRMAEDEIMPDIKDGLAAAKILNDMEAKSDAQASNAVWSQAMTVYFESVRDIMSDAQFNELMVSLERNPVLQELSRKIRGEGETKQIEQYEEPR